MEKLLDINDLNIVFKTYAGEINAVRGVSFHVNKGEILGVVGESGCGKSVTSSAIMRILPTPPTIYKSGSINFQGTNLLELSEKEMQDIRGKDISMVFQDSMASLNPTMRVGPQIMEGIIRHQSVPKEEAKKITLEMLSLVGISNPEKRINQYPHEFSGGMRQRVMIAIALACNPKLLIADEPTTALDVTIQAQILTVIKKLTKQKNTSVILITHDLGVVAETCHRVVVMYAGKVIETAKVNDIFETPLHPYTIGLLASIPHMKMEKDKTLTPIPGSPPDLFSPPAGCSFFARCNKAMKICQLHCPNLMTYKDADSSPHKVACWLHHPKYAEFNGLIPEKEADYGLSK